jgi:hypothetical protein
MRRSKGRKRGRPPALEACSGVWHSTQSAGLEYGTGAYWRNPQRGHLTIGTGQMVAGACPRVIGLEVALSPTAEGVRIDCPLNTGA